MTVVGNARLRKSVFAILFLVLMLLPLFMGPYLLHIMIMTFIFAYLARSWDLIGGYTGQLFLGPAAVFGVGAYTSTILYVHFGIYPWIGMVFGGVAGMIVGVLLCYISFRCGLKGIYFGLATLTFSEICKVIVTNVDLFGGVNGILIPIKGDSFLHFQFDGKIPYYYISFFLMLLSVYVMYRIERSKKGFYFLAIRENEGAAEALGVDTLRYKLISTGIGCFFLAMGGTFHAQYLMFVNPESFFGLAFTIEVIIRSIVGGVGTLLGPVLGSFILTPVSDISRALLGGYRGVHLMVFGVIVILAVLFLPHGVGRWVGKEWVRLENLLNRKKNGPTGNL
jgi:branched-chain amino acid transport system permease protein